LSAVFAALVWLLSPTVVSAQEPNRGSIPETIYAYGMVAPMSSVQVTLSFQRDGMIADISVKVGDRFKKGDNLLRVLDGEIVTAEFDGVVTAISVNKGDHFSAGAPLVTLSRPDHLLLVVEVESSALTKVKPDQSVHLSGVSSVAQGLSLLPDCKPVEGKVKRIGVAIDPKTRLVPVFIELPDGMAGGCGENFKAEIEVGR
jgi:multidrug efflux pump subunit AcrA (membrane-fusion protein)